MFTQVGKVGVLFGFARGLGGLGVNKHIHMAKQKA